ncbi:MAG TPA: HEAT repeat domain-containing protein [Pyrinomonadaceae bacterium]|nr:HEAT repeat domain-containing protein [Pyrinomonadaceae bacterium]
MADNGNHPEIRVSEKRRRTPGSGPILILAILFVAATFLAWYFSWFGRGLSDADISKYLADDKKPRQVQHALLQIQQRMERGDGSAKNWYPQLIALSGNPETEYRLTVAWLMGFDNQSKEFHGALLKLVNDPEPIVRRNAALALVRFGDPTGREELVATLKPFPLKAPVAGVVASSLREEAKVARQTLLARIQQPDGNVAGIRSPLPGRVNKILKPNGSQVARDDEILNLISDEDSVWEALRGLSLVGTKDDLQLVQSYASSADVSARIKEQASATAKAIQSRPTD